MEAEFAASDTVRIPEPREGVATHVHRYHKDRAVILHPRDFARLEALDAMLTAVSKLPALEVSDAAYKSHRESLTPGTPVTDVEELRRLFS